METLTATRSIQQTIEDHIFKTDQELRHGHGHGNCSKPGVIFTNIGAGKRANNLAEDVTPPPAKTKTNFSNINIVVSDSSGDQPKVQVSGDATHGKAGELNIRKRPGKAVAISDPYFSEVDKFGGGKSWTKINPTPTEFGAAMDMRVHR